MVISFNTTEWPNKKDGLIIENRQMLNGKESTVNSALDVSTYPG